MDNFIDQLQRLMQEEAVELRRRLDAEEDSKRSLESHKLDQAYNQELRKRGAIAERSLTLDLAWAASELLSLNKVAPEYWTRTERPVTGKGAFRRILPGSDRQVIVAEGWPIVRWQNQYYPHQQASSLILTPKENEAGTRLTVVNQAKWQGYQIQDPTEKDVIPLRKNPLDDKDIEWPARWPDHKKDWLKFTDVNFDSTFDWKVDGIESAEELALIDTLELYAHENMGTEEGIRRAIARTAALHMIIEQ